MGFNRFIINVITRSLLLALTALGIAFLFKHSEWLFTLIFLCLLFIFQIYFLIRYATKINRDLANFLVHIKEQDTTLAFSKTTIDKTFKGLSKEFEKINLEFKKVNDDKIKKQHLLNQLINQVGTGIIILNEQNEIILQNRSIKDILSVTESNNTALIDKLFSVFENLNSLNIGEQKIETIQINNLTRRILISLSGIKEDYQTLKIYSFHDIDREITDYELQSWNGLIKVLSHEIMNTVTPISTVVDTLKDCLFIEENAKKLNEINEKDISDTIRGINILENRIIGLQDFINKFRQFLDVPVPELKTIEINDLFKSISETYKNKITVICKSTSQSIKVLVDKDLMELTFINIVKNAIEAQASEIILSADKCNKRIRLSIKDNGNGIDPKIMKKVFLPFYTTKSEGSGIGLSLARQIMFAHGGNIEIESLKNGTIIKLVF